MMYDRRIYNSISLPSILGNLGIGAVHCLSTCPYPLSKMRLVSMEYTWNILVSPTDYGTILGEHSGPDRCLWRQCFVTKWYFYVRVGKPQVWMTAPPENVIYAADLIPTQKMQESRQPASSIFHRESVKLSKNTATTHLSKHFHCIKRGCGRTGAVVYAPARIQIPRGLNQCH